MNRRPGGAQAIPRPDGWRPGDAPWWWATPVSRWPDPDLLIQRLGRARPGAGTFSQEFSQEWVATARRSAVLVPIVHDGSTTSLILTKRSSHLRNHRGEISFPGGRVEEAESVRDAALRETEEEIGLPREQVMVVGELDPLTTFVSNSVIVPVVGVVTGALDLRANQDEVESILVVPIAELLRTDTYHNEWWPTPRGDLNIHFFTLDTETIWGATARMLHQFIDLALGGAESSGSAAGRGQGPA